MGYIADEVHRVITDNHLKAHVLPLKYVDDLRTSIVKQYCTKNTTLMWEGFKDCVNYQNSNAWSLICDYVKDNECIMFFNESDDKNAFLIPNGGELQKILEDSFGFEFYITNKSYSYLICFNHHDILYGSGEAKEWVRRLNI